MKTAAWIALAVLALSVLVLFVHLGTSGEDFSRYNEAWTGTSAFFATLDRHTTKEIADPKELALYRNATLLIIAPDRNITAEEGAEYRDFVARGNRIFLADDFGTGPSLLKSMGSGITIHQVNLSSFDRAYDDSSMVLTYPVDDGAFLPPGEPLLLDQAATLAGGEPLIKTTVFSWEDTVPDRDLGNGETLGRFTVMAQEKIGSGTLIVFSDPSVFINGMEDVGYGNSGFREAIANTSPLLIDGYSSRVVRESVTGELIHAARSSTAYTFAAAALLVAGMLLAWHRRVL